MTGTDRTLLALAALNGFMAVVFGAVAAHAAPDAATENLLKTGALWQAVHALATMLAIGLLPKPKLTSALFLGGAMLFALSMYALAFGAPDPVAYVTPAGGVLMLAGWVWLSVSALRSGGDA